MIWGNDHLKIYFPKHKSDQIDLNKEKKSYINSNPRDPVVCPIKALASYLLSYSQIFLDTKKLFPGSDQKLRFHSCLYRFMHYDTHIYNTLFVDPKEIGTHSTHKDTETYCYDGIHPGPPIILVYLRARWNIEKDQERYLKYKNAGDKLVSWTPTNIPTNSCEFGVLPVYFSCFQTDESQVEEFACLVFPIQQSNLIRLSHMFLSTFIYIENWTGQATPTTSRLRFSLYFSFTAKCSNCLSFVNKNLP